jgi:hypothetical protein
MSRAQVSGVSGGLAEKIIQQYPTPAALIAAYRQVTFY